jgi:hypothetical protein
VLSVQVNITGAEMAAALEGLRHDLGARVELHDAMAGAVENNVRGYLLEKNSRSPNTGFYAKASRSVESTAAADAAEVRIGHTGMALRYYGGRVNMKDRFLALPTEHVPVRGDERMRPGEMGDLAFIPKRGMGVSGTVGYLVEGEMKPEAKRATPKPGGRMMFVLRAFTDHQPDETVLPTMGAMGKSAGDAAGDFLSAAMQERGLA